MQRGDCRLATAVPLFLPMPKSKFYAPNFYAGVPLDRADRLRADAERLAAFLRDPESRVVPLWRNRHLIAAESEAVVCRLGEIDSLLGGARSEAHTSELKSLISIPHAGSCLKNNN